MRARAGLAALAALLVASAGAAQTPDSTAAPAPVAEPAPDARPADSLATGAPLPRSAVAPFGPAPGRPLTPVPALTAALDVETLVADRSGAFAYALGAPGRVAGVAVDGLAPEASALMLDGRPFDDLVTGAPRLDLLPAAAIGRVRRADGAGGRALGLAADVRPFRTGVPVTELRYGAGQEGVQHVSATHAQTRRPPAVLRGGSADSRLTATAHVASRRSDGPLAGATLRHLDALARLLLTRPGLAAEAGVVHADRRAGARVGVEAATFGGLFEPTATVLDPAATRRTLRTEAWARSRLALVGAAPLETGASWTAQRLVYVPGTADTLRIHATRAAAFARQPVRAGGHALAVAVGAEWTDARDAGRAALGDPGARLDLHATLADSLALGPLALAAEAGVHRLSGAVVPAASVRAEAGVVFAGVSVGGRGASFVETAGLAGRIAGAEATGAERTVRAEAGVLLAGGPWRLDVRAFGTVRTDARELVSRGDTAFAVVRLDGAVRQGGVGLAVGWREGARRGLYARAEGTVAATADGGTSLQDRLVGALPQAWGGVRLGLRAENVGDGVLDLDLAAVGRGWTAFESRRLDPATGLLALPDPGVGSAAPARATLGLEATATFSERASLFLRYDDVLGGRAVDGALVTRGEPLPAHVLRFGVFWALLD